MTTLEEITINNYKLDLVKYLHNPLSPCSEQYRQLFSSLALRLFKAEQERTVTTEGLKVLLAQGCSTGAEINLVFELLGGNK